MSVSYDPDAGELTLQVDLYEVIGANGVRFDVSADVNIPGPAGCTAGQTDMRVEALVSDEHIPDSAMFFYPSSGYTGVLDGRHLFLNGGKSLSVTYSGTALVRRDIRCISNIALSSGDQVGRFCLGGGSACFQPSVGVDRTAPGVSWVTPREGQVISGLLTESSKLSTATCLVNARDDQSGIAYTENFVDGRSHDKQVTPPWSCEIDTRLLTDGPHTLGVRAYDNAGNSAEASVRVIVNNSGVPVAPGPPESRPAPTPVSTQGPKSLAPAGTAPIGPSPTPFQKPKVTSSRVSTAQAKLQVRKALGRKYRSFAKHRRFSVRCKPGANGRIQTCTVRWSVRGKTYSGRVLVSRKNGSYAVSLKIRSSR